MCVFYITAYLYIFINNKNDQTMFKVFNLVRVSEAFAVLQISMHISFPLLKKKKLNYVHHYTVQL
jgi:hypothetical protein